MKRFASSYLPILILSVVGVFAFSQPAHAFFSIDAIAGSAISKAFLLLSYIASLIIGIFVAVGTALAGYFLNLNQTILEDDFVRSGWTILRDFANLGFVLVIIVIAIATIIRYKEYGVQKLLPRLIAAAILINFSLTLAGIVIGVSNSATVIFLSRVGNGDPFTFASSIAGTLSPQRLIQSQEDPLPLIESDQPGMLESALSGILDLVFTVVFSSVIALGMLAFAFMFLARYLVLVFLLVTLPMVILFSVIPFLKGMWNKWVDYFLRWVFFAPAAAFFMYLAMLTSSAYKNRADGATLDTLTNTGGNIQNVVRNGMAGIILVGLMLGGLIVAQKMGIAGAAGAIKLAQGARKRVTVRAGKLARQAAQRAATRPLRGNLGRKATVGLQQLGQAGPFKGTGRGSRIGNAIARGITRPVRSAGTGLAGIRAGSEKLVSEEAKKLPLALNEQALQYGTASNPARVAILSNLANEHKQRRDAVTATNQEISSTSSNITKARGKIANKEKEFGELDSLGDSLSKAGKERLAIVRGQLASERASLTELENKLSSAGERLPKVVELASDFEANVIGKLPQSARKAFDDAAGDVTGIKLAQLYGRRRDTVMPTKGAIAKQVEELIQQAATETTASTPPAGASGSGTAPKTT